MPDFSNTLIVGISSRTLFDLEEENKLFHEQGIIEYRKLQLLHIQFFLYVADCSANP